MIFSLTCKCDIFPPVEAQECHASTVVQLPDGCFAAAWFAGTREGKNDVAIFGSRSTPDGEWEPIQQWAKIGPVPHWNPVLFQRTPSDLLLFFKAGGICSEWTTWIQHSQDYGRTWTAAHKLVPDATNARGPVKNKPILLSDGTILAGNSLEDGGKWRVQADRGTSDAKCWTASPEIVQEHPDSDLGVIQPTLWESYPGTVHMLTRSSSGFIYRSDSTDGGRTWCPLYKTSLPNNNSGIDLAKSSDSTLLLAYNNSSGNWAARTPLTLAASQDNGNSWEHLTDLETSAGEYSYPSVIFLGNRKFAGTYTNRRHTITFWQGTLATS